MPVRVGTSGWQYRDWRGVLYPAGLAERDWLEHYAGRYGTVENNGTFYRLPAPDTFAGWRSKTPDGFVMAVKASRYLTHVRRLRDPAEPVERLMRAAAGLGDRLGPLPCWLSYRSGCSCQKGPFAGARRNLIHRRNQARSLRTGPSPKFTAT